MNAWILTWLLAVAGAAAEPTSAPPTPEPGFAQRVIAGLEAAPQDCKRRQAKRFGDVTEIVCASLRLRSDVFLEYWRYKLPDDVTSGEVRAISDWVEIFGGWWRRYYEVGGVPYVVAHGGKRDGLFIASYSPADRCDGAGQGPAVAGVDGVSRPERVDEPWVQPVYPSAAEPDRLDGMVLLSVEIDREGHTRDVCVLDAQPRGYGFGEAAVEALRPIRYHPARRDGEAVPVRMTVATVFDID